MDENWKRELAELRGDDGFEWVLVCRTCGKGEDKCRDSECSDGFASTRVPKPLAANLTWAEGELKEWSFKLTRPPRGPHGEPFLWTCTLWKFTRLLVIEAGNSEQEARAKAAIEALKKVRAAT